MKNPLILKEIQLRLNVPQHVLIHLCEKGVITPEIEQTEGRGLKRKFSEKNLFEFALALELRKFQIPILVIKVIITLISNFEASLKKTIPDFKIPKSLITSPISINLHLYAGELLVFELAKKSFIAFDINKLLTDENSVIKAKKLDSLPEDFCSHLEVNLTKLAKEKFN